MPGESDLEGEGMVEFSRQRIFAVIETVLRAASQRRPLVIVCEDLHWADAASLALLEHVLPLCERYPVLFLCVMRPDVGQPGWRLRDWIAEHHAAGIPVCGSIPEPAGKRSAGRQPAAGGVVACAELRSHILERAEGKSITTWRKSSAR
jgi:hypothetical protein